MDIGRIDDLKRRIEDLQGKKARMDCVIELHAAEFNAPEAKGLGEERGGPGGQARQGRRVQRPAEGEVRKGALLLR
jgi:hypothetical protein